MFKTVKLSKFLFIFAVCILSCIGTLYAYFKVSDSQSNQFSIGKNTIEIVETFDPPENPQPGTSFTKSPSVKNTESVPCYVRMFVEFSDSRVASEATIDFNTTDWSEKQEDGYYYYQKVLTGGKTTEPLFTTVSFNADANEQDIQDFDIIVYAESVQSENYSSPTEAFLNYIP